MKMKIEFVTIATLAVVGTAACTATAPDARPRARPSASAEAVVAQLTTTKTIPVQGPTTLLYDRGSVWVGGPRSLARLKGDRVAQRIRTSVTRVGLARVGDQLWATGGGDGAVPDGTVVSYDIHSGQLTNRLVFENRSPYGIDAGEKHIFMAPFQGDLFRISQEGEETSRVPLKDGLTQVLAAHGKVWVSSPQRGFVWQVEFNSIDDTSAGATELRLEAKRSCPQGLASTPRRIWVADPCARVVWLLDPRYGEVVDRVEGLGKPIDIAMSKGKAWVVSFRDDRVTVLDLKTSEVLAEGQAGEGAIAIAAHGRDAWVANHEGNSVTHLRLH